MAQDASKTAQDGLRRLNIGPHMTPSWLKMPRRCLQMTRNIRLDMDRLLLQAVYRHSEQSSRVQSSPVGIVRLEKQPSTNIEIDGQYWAPKLGPTMDPRWPTSHRFILSHRDPNIRSRLLNMRILACLIGHSGEAKLSPWANLTTTVSSLGTLSAVPPQPLYHKIRVIVISHSCSNRSLRCFRYWRYWRYWRSRAHESARAPRTCAAGGPSACGTAESGSAQSIRTPHTPATAPLQCASC